MRGAELTTPYAAVSSHNMTVTNGNGHDSLAKINVSPSSARSFASSLLIGHGVPSDRAEIVADSLVLADLRGVDTHGINRLPIYINRIQTKMLDPSVPMEFRQVTPVVGHLDAKNTFGFVAACHAIDKGIEMASQYGLGMVATKHSNHYGMAATYLLRAINQGYGALVFTNSSPSMPPWGSKEPLFGTSPFAVGVPGGPQGHFILDMSPSVAARGKIRKAARRGEPIPEGYALDAEGHPTTDANAALGGTVLPIGGPKGSGIAMMMDVFGGVIAGASFAGAVNDQYHNFTDPVGTGHWFLVFKPEIFLAGGKEELANRMDTLMGKVRGCDKAAGVKRIYTSGEIEADNETRMRKEGLPFTRGEIETLHQLGAAVGVKQRLETM